MSQARLGELVGRSAATVRAWERGSSVPNDPTVVTAVAAALGLDEAELFRASGLEPPADAPSPTIEQALQTIAPPPGGVTDDTPAEAGDDTPAEAVDETPAEAGDETPAEAGDETPGAAGADAILEPPAPTGRRGRRIRRRESRPVTTATTTNLAPAWHTGEVSYLEDPDQRMIYRLRWIYTSVGLLFLVIVLVWASGRTLEAVGDVLDVFRAAIGG